MLPRAAPSSAVKGYLSRSIHGSAGKTRRAGKGFFHRQGRQRLKAYIFRFGRASKIAFRCEHWLLLGSLRDLFFPAANCREKQKDQWHKNFPKTIPGVRSRRCCKV